MRGEGGGHLDGVVSREGESQAKHLPLVQRRVGALWVQGLHAFLDHKRTPPPYDHPTGESLL